MLLKAVSNLFTNAVEYRQYGLIKKSVRYDDEVTCELDRIIRIVAVQMRVKHFGRRDPYRSSPFCKTLKTHMTPVKFMRE